MAEITTPTGGPRYFSIVVSGVFAPAMHHPLWYKFTKCLTDSEADSAIARTTIASDMAQFQTAADGGIRITCTNDRWEVAVWKEEDRPRILEIASNVFDKLMDTPVIGYAFFSMADLDTKASRVKGILADLAISTGLGFDTDGDRECGFTFVSQNPEGKAINIIIRPSAVHESKVWVSFSTQYRIPQVPGYYVLGPDLERYFDPHWGAAKAMGHRVVARVNERAGE